MKIYEVEQDETKHMEMLNELYGEVEICGQEYNAGYALREIDPTAFNLSMADTPIIWACGKCGENHGEDRELAEECCTE